MKLSLIGKITGTHALKGNFLFMPDALYESEVQSLNYLILYKGGEMFRSVKIGALSPHKGKYLVASPSVSSVEEAALMKGCDVYYPTDMLPDVDPGLTWKDVKGSRMVDEEGVLVGTLVDYMESPTSDIFVVEAANGNGSSVRYLISDNEAHILSFDEATKVFVINREGLIAENEI